MLEELELLITTIQKEYQILFDDWKDSYLYKPLNQKDVKVKDIKENNDILRIILNYRLFINEKYLDLAYIFKELKLTSVVNSRVKAQNSIEYKFKNYMTEQHELRRGIN